MTISEGANSIENQLPEENPSNDMPQEVVIIITISHNVISMLVSKHGPKEQICQQEGWSGTLGQF